MMSSLSRLGIGLSVVFGCFLLALVAELYYVFWWRRRLNSGSAMNGEVEDEYSSPSRELFFLLCWKKQPASSMRALNLRHHLRDANVITNGSEAASRLHHRHNDGLVVTQRSPDQSPIRTDFMTKFFPAEGMDAELMRLHGLLGPPRILFTIKEETKEDLDSEDGRSRKSRRGSRSRSLSDLLAHIGGGSGTITPINNTPFVTPPSSPPFCTPMATPPLTPLTPLHSSLLPHLSVVHNKQQLRLSPLIEVSRSCSSSSSSSASSSLPSSFPSSFASPASHSPLISPPCTTLHLAPNKENGTLHPLNQGHLEHQYPIKEERYPNANPASSPPPKFKFLRDADEKVVNSTAMRLKQQQHQLEPPVPSSPSSCSAVSSDEDGSFITIIVGDSNSSPCSLVHHPSPVSTPNPILHMLPLSPSSPRESPILLPLTRIVSRNNPSDSKH